MEAVVEHLALPLRTVWHLDRCVEVLRRRDFETLHSSRHRIAAIGLHDHVHVVELDADVHDTKVHTFEDRIQRASDRVIAVGAAEIADALGSTHRH